MSDKRNRDHKKDHQKKLCKFDESLLNYNKKLIYYINGIYIYRHKYRCGLMIQSDHYYVAIELERLSINLLIRLPLPFSRRRC